jgi:glycosyltransferase involved in cell wall biosynthesis
MKILKLCTFVDGGATIAARRQKEALRRAGHQCDLAYIKDDINATEIELSNVDFEIQITVPGTAWSHNGRVLTAYLKNNRSEISNTWFSFWQLESFLDDTLLSLCLQYDVIHLHWIAGMVSSKLIGNLSSVGKKIVVTGHDMNHFTGGCHYSAGCELFTTGCDTCPQLLADPLCLVPSCQHQKVTALGLIPESNWIFPSVWLAEAYKRSLLCREHKVPNLIRNCIDVDKYICLKTEARIALRNNFGFGENEIVLVAGASDNAEKRKGFSYLENGILQFERYRAQNSSYRSRLVVVTFGRGKPCVNARSPNVRHHHLGSVNETKVIELFQASDLLLFPSIEENFSNTVLESLMCGCPVLAFNIGGIPDILVNGQNGVIVDLQEESSFSEGICQLADMRMIKSLRSSTELWRNQNANLYSYNKISCELISLYSKVVDKKETNKPKIANKDLSLIYPEIFGKVYNRDRRDYTIIEGNLTKVLPSNNYLNFPRKKIESIFLGFGVENDTELGRVSWLKKNSSVIFKMTQGCNPVLYIRLSNIDWVMAIATRAFENLTAKYNHIAASTRLIKTPDSKSAFIIIAPEKESLQHDRYNLISLSFSESSIPEANDPRGLCLIHNYAGLFDLSIFDATTQDKLLTDSRACNQLLIGADQSHYLNSDVSELKNDYWALASNLEVWADVLQDSKKIMGDLP